MRGRLPSQVLTKSGAPRAECEQGLRYIEAVLGRSPATSVRDEDSLPPLDTLDSASPRLDWDRWGIRLRKRLEAIDRFASRVAACGAEDKGDNHPAPA